MSSPFYSQDSSALQAHTLDQHREARPLSSVSLDDELREVVYQPCKYKDKCQRYNCMYIHHHPRGREEIAHAPAAHTAMDYERVPHSDQGQASSTLTRTSSSWAKPPNTSSTELPDYTKISRQEAHDEYLAKQLDYKLNHNSIPAPRRTVAAAASIGTTPSRPTGGILSQWWSYLTSPPAKPRETHTRTRLGATDVRRPHRHHHHSHKSSYSSADGWSDDLPHKSGY